MKIYISGKISGLDVKDAEAKFEAAARVVAERGQVPVNPMELVPFDPKLTWADYMAEDVRALLNCDGMAMLPCWKESRGAKIEHAIGEQLGLNIEYW
jgi:hypothetical protein